MYRKIDIDNDGEINFTEFLPLMNRFVKIDTQGEEHTTAYKEKKERAKLDISINVTPKT